MQIYIFTKAQTKNILTESNFILFVCFLSITDNHSVIFSSFSLLVGVFEKKRTGG